MTESLGDVLAESGPKDLDISKAVSVHFILTLPALEQHLDYAYTLFFSMVLLL